MVPHLTTALTGPLPERERHLRDRMLDIEQHAEPEAVA